MSERICKRCGNPVDGYGQINDDWYCHPDDETKPDCYSLVQARDIGFSSYWGTRVWGDA